MDTASPTVTPPAGDAGRSSGDGDHEPGAGRWADWPWLLLIGAVALAIRLAWMAQHGAVIENEGSGYARIADNLLSGAGYVSNLPGLNTVFPPLYPMAIALLTALTGSSEVSARLLSCASGVLLLWPVYGITRYLGDRGSALIAAVLAAGAGVLVALSGSAYSESSSFLVFLLAVYFACRLLEEGRLRHAVATGAFFGLAYLVRPEGALFAALAIAFLVGHAVVTRGPWRAAGARILVVGVTFALVAAPYVAWLSVNSGYLRVEGKSLINGIVSDGIRHGLSYQQASYGIGADLEPLGPYLATDQFALTAPNGTGLGFALSSMASDSVPRLVQTVRDFAAPSGPGGPALALLAIVGLVAALSSRRRLVPKLFIAAVGAAYLLILLSLEYQWDRFLFPLVPLAVPWAAVGISAVASAVARLAGRVGLPERRRGLVHAVVAVAATALVVVPSLGYAADAGEFTQSTAYDMKEAGLWLRDRHPATVMGMGGVVPYYAGATLRYLPWAQEADALRYIHAVSPDFIYIRHGDENQNPYIEGWLAGGIPDSCAVPVQAFPQQAGGELRIFEWRC